MGVIHPDKNGIAEFAREKRTTPIMMLNFLRYRELAVYPIGTAGDKVSGRVAYGRYGAAVTPLLERVGARVLWAVPCEQVVIGDPEERCDDVVAVWYPNRGAFFKLIESAEYQAASVHRDAALERGSLYACSSPQTP